MSAGRRRTSRSTDPPGGDHHTRPAPIPCTTLRASRLPLCHPSPLSLRSVARTANHCHHQRPAVTRQRDPTSPNRCTTLAQVGPRCRCFRVSEQLRAALGTFYVRAAQLDLAQPNPTDARLSGQQTATARTRYRQGPTRREAGTGICAPRKSSAPPGVSEKSAPQIPDALTNARNRIR